MSRIISLFGIGMLTFWMITGLSACSEPADMDGERQTVNMENPQPSASPQDGNKGEQMTDGMKLASSAESFVSSQLEGGLANDPPMADSQRAVLERALDNGGKITVADYERVWSDFSQCIVDRGWTKPILIHYPNGMVSVASVDISGLSKAQDKRLQRDTGECSALYSGWVNTTYGVQVGNSSLWMDIDQAIVDCLHRENLVPKEYSLETYQKDRSASEGESSVDFSDMHVRGCMVANGSVSGGMDDPVWDPMG
ncbi:MULTISPECIES: hypothetical protein [Bifidobacterium]|uniref:hypothetical protein n=1 Tax=Bifidobacterium TaxID=1678 RepID=UPI001BDC01C6|nr:MULTISPECIES: hypothetical protein [Bifidobacterium]MBT1162640.1 hypothetical protein [Bifidobacterium sp. SO1]MBW3077927.1 hypothetical protein [Bifidobacterium simiiventris]